MATIVIAVVDSVADYIDNYFTESVGQWVAHDLRIRIYDHLHRLSLGYYATHQTGSLLSTLTSDVSTVQDFASSATLSIVVDIMTIVGMLGIMFWLNWDFALIAIGVTPFLLLFVMRFKKAVKDATRDVRKKQSEIVAVAQQGLGSVRSVSAFDRQDLEASRMNEASRATVTAALKARRVKSLLGPVVSVVVALCTAFVLWRGTALILTDAMTVGRADGIPRVPLEVLQAGAGSREDDQHDRADGRGSRAHQHDSRRGRGDPGKDGRERAAQVPGRDRVRARRVRLQRRYARAEGRELQRQAGAR